LPIFFCFLQLWSIGHGIKRIVLLE
jgi:hypothetical protein